MKILIQFNRERYDSTDVTWNAPRLAGELVDSEKVASFFFPPCCRGEG